MQRGQGNMKLTIENKTNYKTKDLRKLFLECMKREGVQNCYVKVKYSRKSYINGYAWYNSYNVVMFFRKTKIFHIAGSNGTEYKRREITELTPEEIVRTSQVFIHELGHNRGLRHDEMVSSFNMDCSWTNEFQIRTNEKKPKPKRNLKQERYEHSQKKVKQLTTKLKRNQTLLKKWKKKVRYYERNIKSSS